MSVEVKNNFIKGKLQFDLDERLIPDGEYRDALNIRVSPSLESSGGVASNILGNEKLTSNDIADSTVIGVCKDDTKGNIYYFVTSPTFDFVFEYNAVTDTLTQVLKDTAGRVLKFSTDSRISGVNFIIGNTSIGDQLVWTDNLNPPRKVYVDTAKTFITDGFDEDDISVVKRPPFESPYVALVRDYTITSNYLKGEFFMFSYRYIYEGDEVSAPSFFSECVIPNMTKSSEYKAANIVEITVNTGDSRVERIDILFNQPNSSNYYVVEKIDKAAQSIADDIEYTVRFDNNSAYQVLPESDSLRIYDNVPLTALDQNFAANRLMYLNYKDGYDSIVMDYTAEHLYKIGYNSTVLSGLISPTTAVTFSVGSELIIKYSRVTLIFEVTYLGDVYSIQGTYYVKEDDISTLSGLMTSSESPDFQLFLNSIFSDNVYLSTPGGYIKSDVSFSITIPTITSSFLVVAISTAGAIFTSASYIIILNNPTTFLSNNSQEFGIVYYDKYNRSGSVQYLNSGKVFYSDLKTRIGKGEGQRGCARITINNYPPEWAEKYKIVRRDNGYIFNKLFIPIIYKWSERNLYYLHIQLQTDKDKVTIGSEIYSVYDKDIRFTVQAIVSDFPTTLPVAFQNAEFGYFECVLLEGDLGASVPVTPNPPVGTTVAYAGAYYNTSARDLSQETFYECSDTFGVVGGFHEGNFQDQSLIAPAITDILDGDAYIRDKSSSIDLESFKYNDDLTGKKFENVNKIRGNLISDATYQRNRTASVTYSEVLNIETTFNGLNNFNLSNANFKDLQENDGSIQRSFAREGSLLVFQENKVSYILLNRVSIYKADGSVDLSATNQVLGDQVFYAGEYGISDNPESMDYWGNNVYFSDKRRGVVIRLGADGQTEISNTGMKSFFKRGFQESSEDVVIGAYDPTNDEYVFHFNDQTLAFNEDTGTWSSFYSFSPDTMVNLQGKFYSLLGSDLYLHNSLTAPRCTFYGQPYETKISVVANQFPSDVKVFQNLQLEGNKPWNVTMKSFKNDSGDYNETTLDYTSFEEQEGMWYAQLGRNETTGDLKSQATYGIGTVLSISGLDITANVDNTSLMVNDFIYKGSTQTVVGQILNIVGNVISLSSVTGLIVGDFIYGVKNLKIEGSYMRGYCALIDLQRLDDERIELFSVDTFGVKSNP